MKNYLLLLVFLTRAITLLGQETNKCSDTLKQLKIVIDDDAYMELAASDTSIFAPIDIEIASIDTNSRIICLKIIGSNTYLNEGNFTIVANTTTDEKVKVLFLNYKHKGYEGELVSEENQEITQLCDLKKFGVNKGTKLIIKVFNCIKTVKVVYK